MKAFFFLLLAFGLVACDEADRLNGESNGPTGPGGGGGTGTQVGSVNITDIVRGSDRISFRYDNVYPIGTTIVAEISGAVIKTDNAGYVIDVTGLSPNTSYTVTLYARNGSYVSAKVFRTVITIGVYGGSPNAGKTVTLTLNGENVTVSNVGTLRNEHGVDVVPTHVEGYNQGKFNGYVENAPGYAHFAVGTQVSRTFNGFNLYSVINGEKVFINLSGMKLLVVVNGVASQPYDPVNFPDELALTWFTKKQN